MKTIHAERLNRFKARHIQGQIFQKTGSSRLAGRRRSCQKYYNTLLLSKI